MTPKTGPRLTDDEVRRLRRMIGLSEDLIPPVRHDGYCSCGCGQPLIDSRGRSRYLRGHHPGSRRREIDTR